MFFLKVALLLAPVIVAMASAYPLTQYQYHQLDETEAGEPQQETHHQPISYHGPSGDHHPHLKALSSHEGHHGHYGHHDELVDYYVSFFC